MTPPQNDPNWKFPYIILYIIYTHLQSLQQAAAQH
eukprot:COSAG01_NODE_77469_length_163_cov_150.718750_1_plen_34_part_10